MAFCGIIDEWILLMQAARLSPEYLFRDLSRQKEVMRMRYPVERSLVYKMLRTILDLVSILVTIVSIIVTLYALHRQEKDFKHQKSDRPGQG